MQLCTGFNDCKFVITPTVKFCIAKQPKTFYKNTEEKFKCKKKNKEFSSFENRKVHTNFCYGGRKSFVTWQIQYHCYGGPYPPSWFTKNMFLEHHVRSRKSTMVQNVIITFNPTYLIKITYISSILKFLNTENLLVQVSNTKLNIQSLHF